MKEFDKFKMSQEKAAVKITRYNRVPDHLQGMGIALIKCDTAFLPGSIGAGASKVDLKNAQARIMAAKAASQAQAADDAALGETVELMEEVNLARPKIICTHSMEVH